MRSKISRARIILVLVFALLIGSSVVYSQMLEEVCLGMEESRAHNWIDYATCANFGDCGEIEISLNNWDCMIAECWDSVDGVCS